jgi:hypothetical protein
MEAVGEALIENVALRLSAFGGENKINGLAGFEALDFAKDGQIYPRFVHRRRG